MSENMQRRFSIFVKYCCLLFLSTAVLHTNVSSAAEKTEAYTSPRPGELGKAIARMVALRVSNLHDKRQRINKEIGAQAFDQYFKELDQDRYFFLKSDIKEFESYKPVLHKLVLEGKIAFAYDIYERYVKRVTERLEYTRERLEEPFDFSREEYVKIDRSDAEWAKSKDKLNTLWDKRLKNQVLRYKLMQADDSEDDADTQNDSNGSKKDKGNDSDQQDETDDSAQSEQESADTKPPQDGSDSSESNGNKKAEGTGSRLTEKEREEITENIFSDKTPQERVLQSYERQQKHARSREALDILEVFLSSATHVYDPHSAYMAPSTEEDFEIQMDLALEGIGAELTTEDGFVKVNDIIPGGPAAKDGRLAPGDRIIAVAQEDEDPVDVLNMPLRDVVEMIRGPKGTTVYLTVISAEKGRGGVPVVIPLERDEVELEARAAQGEVIDVPIHSLSRQSESDVSSDTQGRKDKKEQGGNTAKILSIKLPSFYRDFEGKDAKGENFRSSARDVKELLDIYKEKHNLDGVLLDLRSNGGGSLEEAIEVAGLFLPDVPVVQAQYANGNKKVLEAEAGDDFCKLPLVVAVNRLSASASEIVAAALKDYGRGVIVGSKKTHGKGTVQSLYNLQKALRHAPGLKDAEPGSLKLTMARFYRVTGKSTQRKGVSSDIIFPSFRRSMELGEKSLDYALPWDKIDPVDLDIEDVIADDVEPHLSKLRERSQTRRKLSPYYDEWMDIVAAISEQQERNKMPLSLDERRRMQKEQEELSDKIAKYTSARPALSSRNRSTEDNERPSGHVDLVLREALHVAKDLSIIAAGKKLPAPKDTADTKLSAYQGWK